MSVINERRRIKRYLGSYQERIQSKVRSEDNGQRARAVAIMQSQTLTNYITAKYFEIS